MGKVVIGFLVTALAIGIAVFFLRPDESALPTGAVLTEPASAGGQIQQLNEVVVRMPAPPAAAAQTRPTDAIASIPLGAEFNPIFEATPLMRSLHDSIEREPREEPWASLMESKWNAAFAENPELLAYGTPAVHCRSTRCVLQLLAFKPSTLDRLGWMQLISKGAGKRSEAEQSAPLVKSIRNAALGSVENDGATVLLYYYEYERSPPVGP
jgi:hypothetical protein